MWRIVIKSVNAHKRRVLATCSAVLLGVAFLAGTLVLGDTTSRGFGDMFSEANAGTDALVRSSVEVGEADFAERGLVDAVDGETRVSIFMVNTGQIAVATIRTPGSPISTTSSSGSTTSPRRRSTSKSRRLTTVATCSRPMASTSARPAPSTSPRLLPAARSRGLRPTALP